MTAEHSRVYYLTHRVAILARRAVWYAANRERLALKRRNSAFRAKRAAYMREYRLMEMGL